MLLNLILTMNIVVLDLCVILDTVSVFKTNKKMRENRLIKAYVFLDFLLFILNIFIVNIIMG